MSTVLPGLPMLQGEVIFARKSEGIKRGYENIETQHKRLLKQYIVSHKKNHPRDKETKIGKGTKQRPGKLEKRGRRRRKSLKKVLTKGGGFGIIAKLS